MLKPFPVGPIEFKSGPSYVKHTTVYQRFVDMNQGISFNETLAQD